MKSLILLLSCFVFISADGQQLSGKINNVTIIFKDSIINNPLISATVMNTPKYKFLYNTPKGKVFESPVDKMRCLSPDFPSHMPVADLPKINFNGTNKSKPEPMPNAFQNKSSIPSPLNEKK